MKHVLIPSGALVAMLVVSLTSAQAATECQAEIVKGRTSHWTYRLIDGRKCWYEGKTQLPKSELFWADRNSPEVREAPQASAAPVQQENSRATNAQASPQPAEAEETVEPEDGSCCWPSQQAGDSFEARWQSLGLNPRN